MGLDIALSETIKEALLGPIKALLRWAIEEIKLYNDQRFEAMEARLCERIHQEVLDAVSTDKLVTYEEAASFIGMHKSWVSRRANSGKLTKMGEGKGTKVYLSEVLRLLKEEGRKTA